MGVTRYCLSFSYYEQLKLPFQTNLTECVVLNVKKYWTVDKIKPTSFAIILMGGERAEYFVLSVFLVSPDCCVARLCGATYLSVVCDCSSS